MTMSDTTRASWRDNMSFDVDLAGHHLTIDAAPEVGGRNYGPKPKALLLTALAGCTGMDVVAILKKMRMPLASFAVEVEGELTDTPPKVYRRIHITYRFAGDALDRAKIERAVELSLTTYCGVTAMLGKTADISHTIVIE